MKRTVMAAAVVAALTAAAVAVTAQGPGPRGPRGGQMGPGGPGGPRGPMPVELIRGLDLSDAQRDQVRTIAESHREAFTEVAGKMRDARERLTAAVDADTVDEAAIRAASANVAAVMADEAVLRAKVRAEIFNILTPEQQQQAKQRPARPRRAGR